MKRKHIYIILGLIAAYFLKKEIEKNAVKRYVETTGKDKEKQFAEKLDKIKTNVFELIEKFHYTYKSDVMTVEDIDNYEKIINNYIVK